jgi:hypothetical protein
MGSIGKQKPVNHQFLNCELEFECPMNWFDLTPTHDAKVKYCEACNKDVHLCITQKDLDTHAEQRHCIAYFKDPDLSTRFKLRREVFEVLVPSNRPIMLTGYPASAKRFSDIFNEDD